MWFPVTQLLQRYKRRKYCCARPYSPVAIVSCLMCQYNWSLCLAESLKGWWTSSSSLLGVKCVRPVLRCFYGLWQGHYIHQHLYVNIFSGCTRILACSVEFPLLITWETFVSPHSHQKSGNTYGILQKSVSKLHRRQSCTSCKKQFVFICLLNQLVCGICLQQVICSLPVPL